MDELFTIIMLTLISVIEILYMLTGSLIPLAAVLILFILILVFLIVFTLRKKFFWKLALLAFLINLLNLGYMFVKAGEAIMLYLALFVNLAGILFSAIGSARLSPKRSRARTLAPKCEIVTYGANDQYSPSDKSNSGDKAGDRGNLRYKASSGYKTDNKRPAAHGFDVEEFIKKLEEEEPQRELEPPPKPTSPQQTQIAETVESRAAAPKKAAVRKRFSPGKYVASKTGRQYHLPRCDWANNIKKQNRVWFASEKAAAEKGYTPHWCLKKNK
jgi:hypothetical protein